MPALNEYPTGPGSYETFINTRGISHSPEAVRQHGDALHQHRLALAAFHGITLEQLHQMQFTPEDRAEAA